MAGNRESGDGIETPSESNERDSSDELQHLAKSTESEDDGSKDLIPSNNEGQTDTLENVVNSPSIISNPKTSEIVQNSSESTDKCENVDGEDARGGNYSENSENLTSENIEGNGDGHDSGNIQCDIRPDKSSEDLEKEQNVSQSDSDSKITDEQEKMQSLYHIKWMKWKNINTPIITQNENGPCPLIAIMNALILERKISIPSMQEIVSANQLMEYLGDCILDQAPERLTEGAQLNYEQNMADAIGIMSKLQTGLDVNVKFTGVTDFEFTPECVVFDLLNIRLIHGWLVDPQYHEAVTAIGNLSYNQLVEKIIASKQERADPELVSEGLVAEAFLEQSAAQLTYHGLYELNTQMGEEELCVFFRNNHFNTLFKHKNELFVLVTDQGFLTEDKVMWETLSNVEGDGYFVDASFRTLAASQPPPPPPANVPSTDPKLSSSTGISQEDQDYLVALSLQEEQSKIDARERDTREKEVTAPATSATQPDPSADMSSQEWSDLQLAIHLQEEEKRQQQLQQQQQQQQQQEFRPAANVPRGSQGQPPNPPAPTQQPRPPATPQPQGTAQNNNEKCTIL